MYNSNKRLLLGGALITQLGDFVFEFAIKWWVAAVSGSAMLLAIILSIETLFSVFFNAIGGVLADARNKKKILIVTDIISGFACFILWFFIKENEVNVVLVSIINVVLAITYSFYSPTVKSIVTNVIDKDSIVKFNASLNGISELIKISGPVIGLFLIGLIGIKGIFLVNGISFLAAAFLESRIKYTYNPENNKQTSNDYKTVWEDFKKGLIYIKNHKQLMRILLLASLVNFFLAGYILILPFHSLDFFTSNMYAKVLLFQSLGGVLATFITHRFEKKVEMIPLPYFLLLTGITLLPVFITVNQIVFIVCIFAYGFFITLFNISFISYIQLNSDENYLGRIFSVVFTVAILCMPFGNFFFGWLYSYTSENTLSIIGISVVILSSIYVISENRHIVPVENSHNQA
ncbi:MFS transporter [Bacillus salacetis]|uniref:MFS transporter n=1 Tax=Bacillus salacetis TaxID=2315464 RepID=UPI003BA0C53D